MKLFIILIVCFLGLEVSAQIDNISSYIKNKFGDEIPFQSLTDIGGAVIGEVNSNTLLISNYRYKDVHYMMLELENKEFAIGEPYDVLKIKPSKKQGIIYGVCRSNQITNSKIIALVNYDEAHVEYFKNVIEAWIVNEETMKFEVYPIESVDCENLDYGL
ncbi:MAG: hypothetical protein RJQ09_14480 [Cyclobacteriaceae bacterium]